MNNDKTIKIRQPEYYSKFQCDPIKCHESCCGRWQIKIDRNTYEKYMQSENVVIKEIVRKGLSKNEASIDDGDYAIINLDKELACPFLNQKNFCEIFINMGEDSLSKTCKTYPRAITLVGDVMERGLEMSCSVAVEVALLNKKGIQFQYVTEEVRDEEVYVVMPTVKGLKELEVIQQIRNSVIELLQVPRLELDEKVELVGCFLDYVVNSIDFLNLRHEELLTKIKEVKTLDYLEKEKETKNKHKSTHGHKSRDSQQFHHLNTLLSMKFQNGDMISFFSKRYIDCLMEVLDTFGRIKEKELEKYYKKNHDKYLKPYLNEKSFILENYLVNYVFIYGMELFKPKDLWNSYLKMCVIYGLLKFNLVGLATAHKGMTDEVALRLIQSLSKTIIPDQTYLQSVIKYLEEKQLVELSEVTTLLKD